MIPILYEKTETAFISNGLGRLRDCISCIVSEERNGIYECDFEYPVDGANYNLIQVGRIIGVTHDDTGDIQPFDIVGFTKPIDGVVTFHCTHISYRMSYLTVTGTNINSLADTFTLFGNATPTNPFTYSTDKTSTGYLGCADGTPRTVRQMLGGIEGSVLDAYGGEYEWDKWTVKLWSARGQLRDFTIRYGVNMLDYNEEYDASGCYSSCIPYWTDGTTTVVGDKQTNSSRPPTGRDQCIPLDVSDKFENQPTKAQVNATGLSTMNGQNPTIPAQSIEVSFVRLQDMGEYAMYQNLLQCSLCDTINVVFPDFNSGGQFKIVKTEWNVLEGKYESMELGDLSVSLSEALGISNTLDKAGVGSSPLEIYPVGSYYETSDSAFDPNATWGGTWVLQSPAGVITTNKEVTVSSAASYYSDSVTLLSDTRYMLLSHTNGGQTSSIMTSSQIEVRSGTASFTYNPTCRTTASSGQGVASWAYIRTGNSTVTVAARCYGYYTTSHKETVRLIAIPLDKSVGAYRWHRTG